MRTWCRQRGSGRADRRADARGRHDRQGFVRFTSTGGSAPTTNFTMTRILVREAIRRSISRWHRRQDVCRSSGDSRLTARAADVSVLSRIRWAWPMCGASPTASSAAEIRHRAAKQGPGALELARLSSGDRINAVPCRAWDSIPGLERPATPRVARSLDRERGLATNDAPGQGPACSCAPRLDTPLWQAGMPEQVTVRTHLLVTSCAGAYCAILKRGTPAAVTVGGGCSYAGLSGSGTRPVRYLRATSEETIMPNPRRLHLMRRQSARGERPGRAG